MTVPGNLSSPLLATAADAAAAVAGPIKSLRFNDSDSAYLNRTPSSAGNQTTWTWSCWVKTSNTSGNTLFGEDGGYPNAFTWFDNNATLRFSAADASSALIFDLRTTALFRDHSSWYHVVCVYDSSNSTEGDRARIYVNGTRITDFGTESYPSQNATTAVNASSNPFHIGVHSGVYYLDGYLADVYFIDGSALDATSFGAYDDNGVWQAAEYSGTYGTNGFHLLDFANESTVGHDSSGNENDFTANNITDESPRSLPAVNFDGADDYLRLADSDDFYLGSGDFTIEAYVYGRSFGTFEGIIGQWPQNGGNVANSFVLEAVGGDLEFYYSVGSTVYGPIQGGTLTTNKWQHVAAVRSGNTMYIFIDGVMHGSGQSVTHTFNNAASEVTIGGNINSAGMWDGYISNVRLVKGTALYTANFTAPATPLANVTNTKLLCCQSNSSATTAAVAPGTITVNSGAYAGQFSDSTSNQDVLFDVPTNGTQSDTGAGGEVSGNYCTLNALYHGSTMSNGNLDYVSGAANIKTVQAVGTVGVSSGKYYFEVTCTASSGSYTDTWFIGLVKSDFDQDTTVYNQSNNVLYYGENGNKYVNSSGSSYGASYTDDDVIGVAADLTGNTIEFFKNGSSQGSISYTFSGTYLPYISNGDDSSSVSATLNFGQRAFAYSAPSGFKALCTTNLPTPTIADGSDYFDLKLYTGDGASASSTQAVTSFSFSPDWLWAKCRSTTPGHAIYDTIRAVTQRLSSSQTTVFNNEGYFESFDSNGFTVKGNSNPTNANNETYVAWCWNAGANSNKTYTVTVVSDSGNKYRFDGHGTSAVTLDLAEGSTYVFDQSDSSNSGHPLRFSTTSDGTHNSGSEYTTGVTATGTPGSAGAKTTIVVAASAPTLYYYCTNHSGMGGQINTNSTAGSTRLSGSENSSAYNDSEVWSTTGTLAVDLNGSSVSNLSSGPLTEAFEGSLASSSMVFEGTAYSSGTKTYTYTFGTAQTNITSARVYLYQGNSAEGGAAGVGNGTVSKTQDGTYGWLDVTSTIPANGTVTAMTMTTTATSGVNSARNGFMSIELNGKMLLDQGVTPVDNFPSINSVVKANPEAGFSIVKWTGNGTAGASVAHSLNTAPSVIITKDRDATKNWNVYHESVGATKILLLNSTSAGATADNYNDTDPTASVFYNHAGNASYSSQQNINGNDYVSYCFTSVAGYSAFGSYTGNGSSDGPFVYTGFRPAIIIQKRTDSTGSWTLVDTARDTDNPAALEILPNSNAAEYDNTSLFDILSNGFKVRATFNNLNASGGSFIYIAFAENPFQANGGLAR